jgi:hypothetical protein
VKKCPLLSNLFGSDPEEMKKKREEKRARLKVERKRKGRRESRNKKDAHPSHQYKVQKNE